MIRAPPQRPKKFKSPATYPELIEEWRTLFKQYTEVEGMRKWPALQRLAYEYGGKSAANVRRYFEPDVRRHENALKKTYPRPDRKTEGFRLRNKTRVYVHRHLSEYLSKVYAGLETPMDLDEITLRLYTKLIDEQKPGVLLKTKTLKNLLEKFDPPLLERVGDSQPPVYILFSRR